MKKLDRQIYLNNEKKYFMPDKKSVSRKFNNIYSLLSNQLEHDPLATAVVFENISLTYKELDEKSNQFANYLLALGVGSGKVIGLSLTNHPNLIIGLLGILKAGGVYLPIDPESPIGHLDYIIKDATPSLLITESHLLDRFSKLGCKVLPIDTDPVWKNAATCFHELPIQPGQLLYIVYTSGSTGKSKGIMLTHDSLPHFVVAREDPYIKNPVSLMLGSIGFDPSILTIFYTLALGGKICLPNNQVRVDIDTVIALIAKFSVNFIICVPSLYLAILKRIDYIPSLRQVSLAGESMPKQIPILHSKVAPNAMLYNEYGPSEYAIGGTLSTIFDARDSKIHEINIGKPLKDIIVYILDQDLKACPLGAKGEIFIGGPGLAKGYLNNQSLTNEKFFSISINELPPILLYQTGDFGCLLPDGNIDFLGRIDYQVKILGYRVELAGIEHTISQFPGIDESVVIANDSSSGEKTLIAYFSSYKHVPPHELRLFLSNLLPKYMVPSQFMQLSQFPLTLNGKIDRKALPLPENSLSTDAKETYSELEKNILKIWQSVLKSEKFSINDNFFDVGGNSVLMLDVLDLIKSTIDANVQITDMFQYPTISQLALHLSKGKNSPNSSVDPMKSDKRKSNFSKFKKPEKHDR